MPAPESNPQPTNSAELDRAVELLRADVPVRDEWRAALLHEVAAQPTPVRTLASADGVHESARTSKGMRSVAVHPLVAIAACIVAMLAGVAGTLAYTRAPKSPTVATGARSQARVVPVANADTQASDAEAGTQKVIRFALVAPNAAHVSIVGDFNNWNSKATPLTSSKDGNTWVIDLPLTAGRHVYAFVVDGDLVPDPSAPRVVDHDFGVQNSVVLVGSS